MNTYLLSFYNSRKKSIWITAIIVAIIILITTIFHPCFLKLDCQSIYKNIISPNLIFIFLISPFLIWIINHFISKKTETAPIAINKEEDFFKGCHQIIHYFDLVGINIATVPIAEIYKTDPSFVTSTALPTNPIQYIASTNSSSVYGDNISSAIAILEAKATPLEPIDKNTLTLIYDYLSITLSRYDNDITVETVGEAMNRHLFKKANFNYTFGAIYVVLFTIICHSYMNSIVNDSAETSRILNIYSNLLHKNPNHDTIKSDISVEKKTVQATTDTLSERILSYKSLLLLRTKWLYYDVAAYPVPSTGGKDPSINFLYKFDSTVSPLDAELQGFNWVYLSEQIIDDMKMYILPILYGLLGSFLFVIRKLFDQAKNYDLTVKKLARHRVRILFGLFVGIFFGYLFTPIDNQKITTFVYAFIAGYNVEILFTVMDKIISTFTSTTTVGKSVVKPIN